MSERVYRVMSRADWEATLASGMVPQCGSDQRDGFVHLSTQETVLETANLYFEPQEAPVVVEIESHALGTALKWEDVPQRAGQTFPHLYAPGIPLQSIRAVTVLNHNGNSFSLGPEERLTTQ